MPPGKWPDSTVGLQVHLSLTQSIYITDLSVATYNVAKVTKTTANIES